MNETIQIDQAGRMVLPKRVRNRFRLQGGDTLAIEVKGDAIELRPTKSNVRLVRVRGVLVLAGGAALPDARDLVAESRADRINEFVESTRRRR
jgi:AbrB family looped-hinge helix DNA binding protein